MKKEMRNKNSEQGSAKVKLVIALLVLFLIGNAGYNYIPIAYEGENLKQEMQTAVVQGMAVPSGSINDMVKGKVQRAMASNNIPPDAFVQVKQANNTVQAHVAYSKQVNMLPFGIYKYNYQFNHIATPTGFLMKQ
jgi:hypothetical protein